MPDTPTEMSIFERVADCGSFASAAEQVGLSPSAVAKVITRLEVRLGVRLINRTTRRLALTTEGEVYLERVREILSAIEAAESQVTSARASPRGHLRVHTFPVLAAHQIAPALPEFSARYPLITFDFMVTNRVVDIIGENVDIALRMGPLNASGFICRKIVDLKRVVCASPGYLAKHGRPIRPSDLLTHSCLILSRNPGAANWTFQVKGRLVRVDVKGPISADSADMLLKLAIQGAGILRLSEHVVAGSIDDGLLQPLLQDMQDPEAYPLYAILPPGRHQAPKVKAFVEFLIERLASAPWRSEVRRSGRRGRKVNL
jgi:DNA-binding transcriptional LysR family regulator